VSSKKKLSAKQKALFDLLKKKSGQELDQDAILKATGWKPTAWRVYCTNGFYSAFLREVRPRIFLVTLKPDVSEDDFRRQVSQSKRTDAFEKPLAQALASRSADNFVLAMEVYNRPSLTNRLDAFAVLFTTAWEQLLKAELVEAKGEGSIFRPVKAGRRRESIGLADCLAQLLPEARDPIRLNVEAIAELRHAAAHLVMPELQPVYSRLFQAGVFNYVRRYRDRTGRAVVPKHNIGLLALAAEPEQLVAAPLARAYGEIVAGEIVDHAKTVGDQIESINDERFAIPVEYTLRFARKHEEADVTLVQATEAPLSAVVFTKAIDPEAKYPLRTEQLRAAVAAKVGKFSSHDLQSALFAEGWKQSDNDFHRKQRNPDTPKFSQEAVDSLVSRVLADAGYVVRARASYNSHLKKAAKGTPSKSVAPAQTRGRPPAGSRSAHDVPSSGATSVAS